MSEKISDLKSKPRPTLGLQQSSNEVEGKTKRKGRLAEDDG
jgi:hypothetical protein